MGATGNEPRLDFESPEFLCNPYPAYRHLRTADPVHQSPWGEWYLTRYDDVARALSDRAFRREAPDGSHLIPSAPRAETALDRLIASWIIYRDPPDHTRLRRLMQGAFTTSRVEALRPRIEWIVEHLLDDLSGRPSFDLVSEFAFPLPVIVICEMLGVPKLDRTFVQDWAWQIVAALDQGRAEEMEKAGPAIEEMASYFREIGVERLRRPRGDLVSDLVLAAQSEGARGEDEFLANCAFLLLAGHETAKNLIGAGVLALLQNHCQWDLLRSSPPAMGGVVEEVLRYESPVQKMCRWTAEPVEMGAKTIPQGAYLVCLIGAANRDPERFIDPERLDIGRAPNGHLAFGIGIHRCLGARLARLEAEIAFAALARRMPDMALASECVDWQTISSLRALKALVVVPQAS